MCAVPRKAVSLCRRTMSRTMGDDGESTFTTVPVDEVRDTELMGTLKLRMEVPAGAVSVIVTLKFAVPGGGVVPTPIGPLQAQRAKAAEMNRIALSKDFRLMNTPQIPEEDSSGAKTHHSPTVPHL